MEQAYLQRRLVTFAAGPTAVVVIAPPSVSGAEAVMALDLESARALIVLNGGTRPLPAELEADLRRSVGDNLAQLAVEERVAVVTGGTDAGVFRVFGSALGERRPAMCVGIAPAGLVSLPGAVGSEPGSDRAELEPHHTHFLLVQGSEWGIETSAMMALSARLADACRSIAVIAGGGAVTRQEALAHVRAGREVIIIAGTGGTADVLAAAARAGASDGVMADAAASGLLTVVDRDVAKEELNELLRLRLGVSGGGTD